MRHSRQLFASLFVILNLLWSAPALASHGTAISIDGAFGDWTGTARVIDDGGADDETSPQRSDITELRTHSTSTSLQMVMTWDDTAFTGGGASTVGVTLRGGDGSYYRIYVTAQGTPGMAPLSSLTIARCTTTACSAETTLCDGPACTGASAGSSTTWVDPFPRATGGCNGTDCLIFDTAVELEIPWSLIGGAPTGTQRVFLQYHSYPSGPGKAQKDSASSNGISCSPTRCQPTNPTAITLLEFRADAQAASQPAAALALLVLGTGVGLLLWQRMVGRSRRQNA